jgi:D-threo-aldose 1-dehydrogenase
MGIRDRSKRQCLLSYAFDRGVTHFDVSRLYGLGFAEAELGRFIATRRNRLTIATKFGLDPLPLPRALSSRLLARLGQRSLAARIVNAKRNVLSHRFSVDQARTALETSLRRLNSDHIDLYLLHDCNRADVDNQELLCFLETAKADGKIGSFGLATNLQDILDIAEARPEYTSVLQFENNALSQDILRLPNRRGKLIITHRALGASLVELKAWLAEHPNQLKVWSSELDFDLARPHALSQAMLAYALAANPKGIVLFSTRSKTHMDANFKSLDEGPHEAYALRFADLVAHRAI